MKLRVRSKSNTLRLPRPCKKYKMSVDELPTEILEQILRFLNVKDLSACRLVNQRWFDLSSVVLDSKWRKTCQAAFPDASAEARRKSQYKLSWEQLHRSLSLCSHMSEAKITSQSKQLPNVRNWKGSEEKKRHFTVLDNGLVATPVYSNKKKFKEDKGEKVGDVWVYKYEIKPDTEELSKLNKDEVCTTQELLKILDSDTDQGPSNKKQKLDESARPMEESDDINEKPSDEIKTENMEINQNDNSVETAVDTSSTVNNNTDKTNSTEAKSTRSRKRKSTPNNAELVTDAVNNEATTSKRNRGRPKSAKLIIDTAKTEASSSKKDKSDQQKVNIEIGDTAKTETRRGMRTRSSNKNTVADVAQNESVPNKKTPAQNTRSTVKQPDKHMGNATDESANIGVDNVFSKKVKNVNNDAQNKATKNIENLAKDIEKEDEMENFQLPKHSEQKVKTIDVVVDAKNVKNKGRKNKTDQSKNRKSTALNDNDTNTTITTENNISINKNENTQKPIDYNTVNKENLAINNNYIVKINQSTVNPDAPPIKSTSNNEYEKKRPSKRPSNTLDTDDEFAMELGQERKKKKYAIGSMNIPCCNSILYLDIDTLSERHLETYDFEFNKYAETDEIIVFRSCQWEKCMLIIGYKMEGRPLKLHSVGAMRVHGIHYTDFFIVDDTVYYQDEDEILTKVSPKTDADGDKIPQMKKIPKFSVKNDEILKEFHNNKMIIIGIVKVDGDFINILTDNTETLDKTQYYNYNLGEAGRIYSLNIITEEFTMLDMFTGYHDTGSRRTIHNRLHSHGFDFSEERVFAWLSSFVPLTKLKKTVVHRHDKVVIIGNRMKTLFIHSNPFRCSGEKLYLYTAKPTLKIDLKKLDNVRFNKDLSPGLNKMSQIDAIPTVNGVKILILIAEMLVSVDLTHDTKPEGYGKSKPKQARREFWARSWYNRRRYYHDEMSDFDELSDNDREYESDDDDYEYVPEYNPCLLM